VDDEATLDLALLPLHAPAFGRGHAQHGPRARPGLAARPLISGQRGALGGGHERLVLRPAAQQQVARLVGQSRDVGPPQRRPLRGERQVRIGPADGGGDRRDLAPVGAQLLRHDLRQQRGHALAHFELRHGDGHHAVGADRQPSAEGMLALPDRQRRVIAARD
jgi:hypothetical protein